MPVFKLFATGLILLFTVQLTAQNTYQQLLPAANNGTAADGTNYTWSLGDVFADDVTGSQAIIISRVEENLAALHGLRLLGNPTEALTRLEVSTPLDLSYRVYDLNGRLLMTQAAGRAERYDIDLGQLPANVYLLSVFTTEGHRLMATYRIRKR